MGEEPKRSRLEEQWLLPIMGERCSCLLSKGAISTFTYFRVLTWAVRKVRRESSVKDVIGERRQDVMVAISARWAACRSSIENVIVEVA